MDNHQTPARRVIAKCGGVPAVAAMIERDASVVRKWRLPKEKGGTGGMVPTDHAQRLLDEAQVRGIDLRPDDFFSVAAPDAGGAA